MDDTRSPGPTFQGGQDQNDFGPRWTHFRVFRGLFWVKNGPFMAHLILEGDDTRCSRPTLRHNLDENDFRVLRGLFWVLNGPVMARLILEGDDTRFHGPMYKYVAFHPLLCLS